MAKPRFEKDNVISTVQTGAKRLGKAAATGGGVATLMVLNAGPAYAIQGATGGAAAPEAPGATGGAAPSGGTTLAEQMTAAQARLNARAQRDANRLGWLAAGTNTSGKTVTFVPAVGGGELAETHVTVAAGNRDANTPGQYTFDIVSAAVIRHGKPTPNYNQTQQVVVAEGPADSPTVPYAQLDFTENMKTDAWSFEGRYTGSGHITVEGSVLPQPRENQLTTYDLNRAVSDTTGQIDGARLTIPAPVRYLRQAFPQPGDTLIPDL